MRRESFLLGEQCKVRRWFRRLLSSSLFLTWRVNLLWERNIPISLSKSVRLYCDLGSLILPVTRHCKVWHCSALLLRCAMEMQCESLASWRACFVSHLKAHLLCSIPVKEIQVQPLMILEKQFKSWLQSWENAKEGLPSMHRSKFSKPRPFLSLCDFHTNIGSSPSCP